MTLDELRATKRDAILAIAARHGVSGIRVFGSFARGEARNDSDLDLPIEAGPVRTPEPRAQLKDGGCYLKGISTSV